MPRPPKQLVCARCGKEIPSIDYVDIYDNETTRYRMALYRRGEKNNTAIGLCDRCATVLAVDFCEFMHRKVTPCEPHATKTKEFGTVPISDYDDLHVGGEAAALQAELDGAREEIRKLTAELALAKSTVKVVAAGPKKPEVPVDATCGTCRWYRHGMCRLKLMYFYFDPDAKEQKINDVLTHKSIQACSRWKEKTKTAASEA